MLLTFYVRPLPCWLQLRFGASWRFGSFADMWLFAVAYASLFPDCEELVLKPSSHPLKNGLSKPSFVAPAGCEMAQRCLFRSDTDVAAQRLAAVTSLFLAASDDNPQLFMDTVSKYYDNRSVVLMPVELRKWDGGSAPPPGRIVKMELIDTTRVTYDRWLGSDDRITVDYRVREYRMPLGSPPVERDWRTQSTFRTCSVVISRDHWSPIGAETDVSAVFSAGAEHDCSEMAWVNLE